MMTDVLRPDTLAAIAASLACALAACSPAASGEAATPPTATPSASAGSLASVSASWELDGSDVLVHVEATGFDVRFAQDEMTGATGHLHLFVDRAPVSAGGQIGFEEGIIHTANREIRVPGLEPGSHTIWVVVADGTDAAFDPLVAARLDVTVE
jgi:hypothetical protein